MLAGEVATAPLVVLRRPLLSELNDHVRVQADCLLADQRLQGIRDIAEGNTVQVQLRDQLVDVFAARSNFRSLVHGALLVSSPGR